MVPLTTFRHFVVNLYPGRGRLIVTHTEKQPFHVCCGLYVTVKDIDSPSSIQDIDTQVLVTHGFTQSNNCHSLLHRLLLTSLVFPSPFKTIAANACER